MGRMLNPKKKKSASKSKQLSDMDLEINEIPSEIGGIYRLMMDSVQPIVEKNPCKEVELPKASFSKVAMDYHRLAFGNDISDISDIISGAMERIKLTQTESSPGRCNDIWGDEDW